jgi:hypothetical protein
MKKIILLLIVLISFGISANAKKYYSVVVQTVITYYYSDAATGQSIGTSTTAGSPYTTNICADTEYAAQQAAISECGSACQSGIYKDEPSGTYQGKSCKVKSGREPSTAKATDLGRNCD